MRGTKTQKQVTDELLEVLSTLPEDQRENLIAFFREGGSLDGIDWPMGPAGRFLSALMDEHIALIKTAVERGDDPYEVVKRYHDQATEICKVVYSDGESVAVWQRNSALNK